MLRLGMWIWGAVLIAWLILIVVALSSAPDAHWYASLKDHDSLAAAVTAVLGVIWSWFFQLARSEKAGK